MSENTTPTTKSRITSSTGREYMYVCQNDHCGNVEKEFALHSRNYKYCSKCGWISVKSNLVSTFNWVASYTAGE